jgi:transcriptional regulator with XRE-family HTH domain
MKKAAEMVKAQRLAGKLSVRQLAVQAQLSSTYLHRFECGKLDSPPSEAALLRLAQALGLELDDLLVAAGRIPDDVVVTLLQHPDLLAGIRAEGRRRETEALMLLGPR